MNFKDLIKISNVKKLQFAPHDIKSHDNIGGGIYRMYDKQGRIIYVGKSQHLHRRLLQHVGKDTNTAYFIDEVDYFEVLKEPSPIYQNLLEAIFIAFHKPLYNDEVKDEEKMKTPIEKRKDFEDNFKRER
jgi:excinuclease UvrABC nuclease subunit